MRLFDYWVNTYLHNCRLEELGMIALKPITILMTTGEIAKNVTLATTFQKLAGEQIRMSGLYTANWQFYSTPEDIDGIYLFYITTK